MLGRFDSDEAEVTEFTFTLDSHKVLKLLDRLGSDLIVDIADALQRRLGAESSQNVGECGILHTVVVEVDLFDGEIWHFLLLHLRTLCMVQLLLIVMLIFLEVGALEYLSYSLRQILADEVADHAQDLILGLAEDRDGQRA